MRSIEKCSIFIETNICDIVLGFSEARCRHAAMLLERQRHALAEIVLEHSCERIPAHSELENLRHCTWKIRCRQLAFPRFAEPSPLRDLLHISRAILARVCIAECDPRP